MKDIATGVDIEDISRFEKYSSDKSTAFVKRIFSENEINYCFSFKNPSPHLAVRFSAKEAVYKALSALQTENITYSDVEIYNTDNGVPKIRILKKGFENYDFRLSLSHGSGCAIASVIVIKN